MAPNPRMNSTWPPQSKERAVGSRDSSTLDSVRTAARMPTGTLTRNTPRQLQNSVMTPPMVGPSASPSVAIAIHIAIALDLARGSVNAALTTASDATLSAAAAVPWTARAGDEHPGVGREGADERSAGEADHRDEVEPAAASRPSSGSWLR